MNHLLVTLIGGLAFGATLPAFAGPDWQAIEHGRRGKQAELIAHPATVSPTLVLPLDHGPRAQTTPYLNRLRRERFEAHRQAVSRSETSPGVAAN
ncbi:MAG TPA: hypothetical protein VFU71_23870 [Burkholderiaceae bacterium]|nr:hypothetical protein [Burkholderiaceae bacterium]